MPDLNAALNDLRDCIVEDGFTPTLVAEIAKDWEVNPALLGRKFEEKHGKAPSDYTAMKAADRRAMAIETAMKAVVANADRFDGSSEVCGKPFTHNGEEYIAVAIAVGGLRCVKVANGKWWKFGNSGKDAVAAARRFNLI